MTDDIGQARKRVLVASYVPLATRGGLEAAEQCIAAGDVEACGIIVPWLDACMRRSWSAKLQRMRNDAYNVLMTVGKVVANDR